MPRVASPARTVDEPDTPVAMQVTDHGLDRDAASRQPADDGAPTPVTRKRGFICTVPSKRSLSATWT